MIKDFKFTVDQAVKPVEKRFDKLMKKKDKRKKTQDDNLVSAATPKRPIRGIDDPLLSGSASDSGVMKGKNITKLRAQLVLWTAGEVVISHLMVMRSEVTAGL